MGLVQLDRREQPGPAPAGVSPTKRHPTEHGPSQPRPGGAPLFAVRLTFPTRALPGRGDPFSVPGAGNASVPAPPRRGWTVAGTRMSPAPTEPQQSPHRRTICRLRAEEENNVRDRTSRRGGFGDWDNGADDLHMVQIKRRRVPRVRCWASRAGDLAGSLLEMVVDLLDLLRW
jgi:hypothetical protein